MKEVALVVHLGIHVQIIQFRCIDEHKLQGVEQTTLLDPLIRDVQFLLSLLTLIQGRKTNLKHRRGLLNVVVLDVEFILQLSILFLQNEHLPSLNILEYLLHPLQETKQIGCKLLILFQLASYLNL